MTIVADDHCIINTQGIRFVEKYETTSTYGKDQPYGLRVTYKGDRLDYKYADKDKRDAQYEALKLAVQSYRMEMKK